MTTTPTPPGPWLGSDAARAIGPVERVHGPAGDVYRDHGCMVAVAAIMFLPGLLIPLALIFSPRWSIAPTEILPAGVIALVAICIFGGVLADVVRLARRDLAVRVLVGARGLARWTPGGATVVLWADLGTAWTCHPARHDPSVVELRRADGAALLLDCAIAGHHAIIARVAAELAGRVDRRTLPHGLRGPSDAIRPDEPGVAETL